MSSYGHQTVKPRAVIYDMDGTLADVTGIRHYVMGGPENYYKKDFDAFHRESVNAPPHAHVVRRAQITHAMGFTNIIVTARGSNYRHHTAMWLALNNVPSAALYMRPQGDFRPDYEVKSDIYERVSRSFDVVQAVDDNPKIIKLWNDCAIESVICIPGYSE